MSSLELTYQSFLNRISVVSRKDILFNLYKHSLVALSAFVVLALALVSSEAVFGFSSMVRKILFFGYLSAFFATAVLITLRAVSFFGSTKKPYVVNKYANRIGGSFPEIKDNLLNAIQIYGYSTRKENIFSGDLVAESINLVNERSKPYDFSKVISFGKLKSSAIVFALSLLTFTTLMLVFPNIFQAAANRLVNYNFTYVENSLGVAFEVKPGNTEVSKGENVEINAKVLFNDPNYKTDQVNFITKTVTDEGIELSSNTEKLSALAPNEFKANVNNVNTNTLYSFEYKGIKSSEYKITVTGRPVIKGVKITVYPPAYTKLPSRVVEGTEISTIMGSRIYFEIESSDNISKSFMQLAGGSPLPLEINGKNASGSFTATRNGTFRFNVAKDFNGKELASINAVDYTLNVIPDEYPKISVVEPNSELSLKGEDQIEVRSRISDDFGFTKMRLGYKISKSKYGSTDKDFKFVDIPIQNTDATGLEVPYEWNLTRLNLGTEDEVEYFVEVYDNDAYSGPKMTRSDTRKLIYPSLDALLNKTEKTKDDIENSLKSAYDDAMELKKDMDELKEKLDKNPEELGLNDAKKQQEMQNKIDNIQNQFQNTQKKLDDLMQDLQNNNQISKETLEKYMELQKMLQRIDSKELRDMLKKLQEAMKNMNPDQLKEAMKNFKFDEDMFKQSLEKTMELLNKVLNEQKLGELTKKLDEITKKQDEAKEQTKNTDKQDLNKLNDISKTQQQIKDEYENFQKQLKELNENMKKMNNDQTAKDMDKMLQEMMKKQLEQKMQNASEDLQNSDKNSAQDKQNDLSQDLNQMNQQMQDILSNMMQNENSKMNEAMQKMLDKMKEMSKKQGDLKEETKDMDKKSSSDEFKEQKEKQDALTGQLSKTIDDFMSLSSQMGPNPMLSKNLGDAYNDMGKASDNLGKKNSKDASSSQGSAKENLDKAIEKMEKMCKNGKPGNGKSGSSLEQLLQALQQMIQKQQSLNQKMGEMGTNGNQGNLTQEQMSQMQKLSGEQQTIQKNMQQLNEEFKKQQEETGKKLLGNLDEVQKDMMEVIQDLQNNNITPETKKRQEKILSRMLDFQLSQREKDFEQKRESRPGKNFDRSSPPEIVLSRPNIINGVNQDALDVQKESYSDDYEALIQKYMEKMRSINR